MTETDKKLKIQFTEGLQTAEKAQNDTREAPHMVFTADDVMPWQKAQTMEANLVAEQKISSVCPPFD